MVRHNDLSILDRKSGLVGLAQILGRVLPAALAIAWPLQLTLHRVPERWPPLISKQIALRRAGLAAFQMSLSLGLYDLLVRKALAWARGAIKTDQLVARIDRQHLLESRLLLPSVTR
jgi:hypothetical protein